VTVSVDTFKSSLQTFVSNFESDQLHYRSQGYLEAQARIDFITPFFEALGWDVGDKAGLRHDQREVIVEKGESDTAGRPDYSFRVGAFASTKNFVWPSEPLNIAKHTMQVPIPLVLLGL